MREEEGGGGEGWGGGGWSSGRRRDGLEISCGRIRRRIFLDNDT